MTCTIGTTSYGYRYQLLDEREAPPLSALVRQTRAAGLDALQICENARPLQAADGEWRDTVRAAEDEGVALYVGCMTLDPEVLVRYLNRASAIGGAASVSAWSSKTRAGRRRRGIGSSAFSRPPPSAPSPQGSCWRSKTTFTCRAGRCRRWRARIHRT